MRHLFVPLLFFSLCLLLSFIEASSAEDPAREAKTVYAPPASEPNTIYVSNRAPMTVSPLVTLPIGAVEPRGWLLSQLQLMRNGFTGRLAELSQFLKDDSGWI